MFDHGVPENTIRHGRLLAGYFGSVAIAYLIMNLFPGTSAIVGACLTGSAAGFYVLWAILLKPDGQEPIERLLVPERAFLKGLPWPIRRMLPY